ncbi:MAG: LysM peptidoglycan-binding domain-containing protein [Anaerolineales bacterium]|jgi:LysM repeat protein|nr:LysM peptidoglycan-binding domain-containing protein [Anaerolineales bacterium]
MWKRIGMLFLALTILAAAAGFSVQPAQAATCGQWYTVRHGDTLYKIGLKFGVTWKYLVQLNDLANPNKIYSGQVLCVATKSAPPPPANYYPYFMIDSVVRDKSVTITTYHFPPQDNFRVLMGPYGTQAKNGIKVGNYSSGGGASKTVTYPIPDEFKGDYRIAIRLESTTGSGFFAYNWFYNNTAGGGSSSDGGSSSGDYSGYPYFFIQSVVRDDKVTIIGYNYPKNTDFTVYMGPYGMKGKGGYFVTSFNSGKGGTIQKTFFIPPELYGSTKIAIRTEDTPWYAYNWFWNNTAVDP